MTATFFLAEVSIWRLMSSRMTRMAGANSACLGKPCRKPHTSEVEHLSIVAFNSVREFLIVKELLTRIAELTESEIGIPLSSTF